MNQQLITDHERMGDKAFDQMLIEYWAKEKNKPHSIVVYLPTARHPESLIGPLID